MHVARAETWLAPLALLGEDGDAVLGLYSSGGSSWDSALALATIDPGTGALVDKWAIARTTPAASSKLRFTYGSDPSYALNPTVMTLEPDGSVGIGIVNPGTNQLHVFKDDTQGNALEVGGGGTAIYATGWDRGLYAFGGDDVGIYASTFGSYAVHAENEGGGAGFFEGALGVGDDNGFISGDLVPRVELGPNSATGGGGYAAFNTGGAIFRDTIRIEATDPSDSGSRVVMRNAAGADKFILDTNNDGNGSSRVITDVLEIRGGADLVEGFEAGGAVEPGSVLVIDPARPGELRLSSEPYDKKVAGVVSGAGGIRPGLSMGQEGVASGDTPVALTGRVYVRATCEAGPIRPGDRLTTSSTPGCAMRVADANLASRADGAVLGKAMSALDAGTGLVLCS